MANTISTAACSLILSLVAPGMTAAQDDTCRAWKNFDSGSPENVLLDFSYAGYKHGEVGAPATGELGYKVFNVCDYGAVPGDGRSDREAFINALIAAGATRTDKDNRICLTAKGGELNAVIYFPEGVYDLQCDSAEVNRLLRLNFGNVVIKGAGRDRTTVRMTVGNELANPGQLWTTPTMIEIGHTAGPKDITAVTGDSPKGAFSVDVADASGLKEGQWVCLYLLNNHPDLVARELAPFSADDLVPSAAIVKNGVEVVDYHQIASVDGNRVTFREPLMHEVESAWGWKVMSYPNYGNVGVEDIAFEGDAKDKFEHHKTGADDGAFKLISYNRLTDSYMRRVDFRNVSEASEMINCANVSVYDIHVGGMRGHSAIRSNRSSRVFIGKVRDDSYGYTLVDNKLGDAHVDGVGQFHGCGVSKPSIGTVIWNVTWGSDACFESHATQPRATLFDCCTGPFVPFRQGGAENQLPNHLSDLTFWNMNFNGASYHRRWENRVVWWDPTNRWWKILNPIIVGAHGTPIEFAETFRSDAPQYKYLESNGAAVEPQSLYEAQLTRRLGETPQWLKELKEE